MLMDTKPNTELYTAPETKVLELSYEGIVCISDTLPNPDVDNTDI